MHFCYMRPLKKKRHDCRLTCPAGCSCGLSWGEACSSLFLSASASRSIMRTPSNRTIFGSIRGVKVTWTKHRWNKGTELIRWHAVNVHLEIRNYLRCFWIFSRENFEHLTSPGLTVPTAGDTVSGAPVGTTNSNDVGPTSTMGPEPILGTGWVNSLALVCELMTSIWAEHVSLTAVAFIFITECDSSSGGRTPTARQWILNSRPIPVLQVRSNSYSWIHNNNTG